MIFDRENWMQFVDGFSISDCAIRSKDMFMFVLTQNTDDPYQDPLPRTRFLMVYADEPVEERFYCSEFSDFDLASIAFHNFQDWEFVAVDLNGRVYSHDNDQEDKETNIPCDLPQSKFITPFSKCVRINGAIHAVAWDRRIFSRKGMNQWEEITQQPGGIPYDQKSLTGKAELSLGFNDLDAFNSSDIYAVGGAGDVWHYNGKKWQQIHFPSNELLYTVCCAGDGNVYITGNLGSLWVGREDRWKKLAAGELSLSFKDSAWFAGRLFCGNDYGLWVMKNGKLESLRDEVGAVVATSCGRIDISPDGSLMLTAGPHGASLYDGQKWDVLFNALQLG